jgi:hypothetical protein
VGGIGIVTDAPGRLVGQPDVDAAPKGCAVNMLVTLLSEQHPLCAACLSAKSGLRAGDVVITLRRLLATISAERNIGGRCRACAQWTIVYSPSQLASRTRAVIVAA